MCRYYHCKYIISYESCVTPVIWPVLGISYCCCSWWWAASLRSSGVSEKVIGETRGGLRCRRCHLCIKMRIIRGSADAGRTRPVIFNTHWSKSSGKGRERTQRDGRGIRGTADFTRWILKKCNAELLLAHWALHVWIKTRAQLTGCGGTLLMLSCIWRANFIRLWPSELPR